MLRAALALILLAGCSGGAADVTRDEAGRATEAGEVRADRLRVGDCFDDQDDQSPAGFPVRPCDEPHDNEVYARLRAPGRSYPGQDVLTDLGTTYCRGDAFDDYVGASLAESGFEVFQVLPSRETWERDGDRTVLCALFDEDLAPRTRSARATPPGPP